MPDVHPFVCVVLALVAGFGSAFFQQAAVVFWRTDPWQARRTVLSCRIMAVVFALLAAVCFMTACLYAVVALVQLLDVLYGWGVL